MPELPEVYTVCKILNEQVKGKTIESFQIFYGKLLKRPSIEEFKMSVKNQKIKQVFNIAKYIIIELETDVIISHLRMEGRWLVEDPDTFTWTERHLEAQFLLDNGKMMRYYDTRKFGTLELLPIDQYYLIPPISNLGLDPTKDEINITDLYTKIHKLRSPIKTVLLAQNILSGIGNIYANEILFAAKISPFKIANELTRKKIETILSASQEILTQAKKSGGTTIHSFEATKGVKGNYQDFLKVHGKVGKQCVNCNQEIKKYFIGGRGTYFCLNCQK